MEGEEIYFELRGWNGRVGFGLVMIIQYFLLDFFAFFDLRMVYKVQIMKFVILVVGYQEINSEYIFSFGEKS